MPPKGQRNRAKPQPTPVASTSTIPAIVVTSDLASPPETEKRRGRSRGKGRSGGEPAAEPQETTRLLRSGPRSVAIHEDSLPLPSGSPAGLQHRTSGRSASHKPLSTASATSTASNVDDIHEDDLDDFTKDSANLAKNIEDFITRYPTFGGDLELAKEYMIGTKKDAQVRLSKTIPNTKVISFSSVTTSDLNIRLGLKPENTTQLSDEATSKLVSTYTKEVYDETTFDHRQLFNELSFWQQNSPDDKESDARIRLNAWIKGCLHHVEIKHTACNILIVTEFNIAQKRKSATIDKKVSDALITTRHPEDHNAVIKTYLTGITDYMTVVTTNLGVSKKLGDEKIDENEQHGEHEEQKYDKELVITDFESKRENADNPDTTVNAEPQSKKVTKHRPALKSMLEEHVTVNDRFKLAIRHFDSLPMLHNGDPVLWEIKRTMILLEKYLSQVIAQAMAVSSLNELLTCVKFVLTNGRDWIFGLVNSPPRSDKMVFVTRKYTVNLDDIPNFSTTNIPSSEHTVYSQFLKTLMTWVKTPAKELLKSIHEATEDVESSQVLLLQDMAAEDEDSDLYTSDT